MERVHFDLRITGKVQGVWYRKSAVEVALQIGIAGFAMNLPDGSVRIEAEGPREALERFVEWCRTGPPRAVVEHVYLTDGPLVEHMGFETRR